MPRGSSFELLGRQGLAPGVVSGRVFAISTVGSIIGTILTPLLFFVVFGTHITFVIVATLSMILAGVVAKKGRRLYLIAAIILLALLITLKPNPLKNEQVLQIKETAYQIIRLVKKNDWFRIIYNEGLGTQSLFHPDTPWTQGYWDWAAILPQLNPHENQSTLVIGLAGASIPRIWRYYANDKVREIDGVEIDSGVVDIVRQYFDQNVYGTNIIIDDGRKYLLSSNKLYDLIFVDAYANGVEIPFHLATYEFFNQAKAHLNSGGIISINVALASEQSKIDDVILNTAVAVFPYVYTLEREGNNNKLVIASNLPIDETHIRYNANKLDKTIKKEMNDLNIKILDTNPQGNFIVKTIAYDLDVNIFTDDKAPVEFMSNKLIFNI